ncbi:ER degradation-enhancing alpha-mannosidase-like protein 3 [Tigriopus californicus]|uniref:ER degradation-enhancing alpha-mannosidase-like protein 3 n=1 Tax=Tigriopus californicus TaxID=6832 RepID=UPI0027DA88B6|nr:ER degradation-enhancing alpha-mannosidase-like protein 3 [Tigriopus californicus]
MMMVFVNSSFSLTLVDSLDTILIMGDLPEFEHAVKLVIEHVEFDHDIVVSVFETNIRMVGGLLAGHVLSEYVRDRYGEMVWYKGELLNMALDIGYRLLPAFNSSTGLPHPRVNLRYGIKSGKIKHVGETCTACAGTMILEFAALSRLSGEPIFEEKASKAMDVLWSARNRMSNLVGNVLNINTGDWVRRDSGIGAGIDSYYEYVAKAYVLLGEDKYLTRWQTHYTAIMKYLGQRPLLQDVHMHRPQTSSKHFIDSLGAFWPGLQVLMGDVKPAIESHEILYQVMQRHNFIPEAFTTDYHVHWAQHLLRPEFVESTYFLYRATEDPHYLEVGKKVLESLQKYAKTSCGYATLKDVRTLQKEDRMDSFVLAETFKYLYLLFAEEQDLILDINTFVFTTEAHLLPLSLARLSNRTAVPLPKNKSLEEDLDEDVEFARSCPSSDYLFPNNPESFVNDLRLPLANTVTNKCPMRRVGKRKLLAADFQSGNEEHMELIKKMGITIVSLPDGRVQLLQSMANSASLEDGEEGILFMQEMIELSKQPSVIPETPPKAVTYTSLNGKKEVVFAGPAQFGKLLENGFKLSGDVIQAEPKEACGHVENGKNFWGKIVVVHRGECMFVEKARNLESLGAKGGLVIDNIEGTSASESPMFAMSGDGTDDISIPMLFLFNLDGLKFLEALEKHPEMEVTLTDGSDSLARFHRIITRVSKSPVQYFIRPAEDSNVVDEGEAFDFTSPVKRLVEKSRHYFSGIQDSVELGQSGSSEDPNEPSDTIQITTRDDGTTIAHHIRTVKGPDGQLQKQITVEQLLTDAQGSISVKTLTDEEVEALLAQQKTEEEQEQKDEPGLVIPRVLSDSPTDQPIIDVAAFEGIKIMFKDMSVLTRAAFEQTRQSEPYPEGLLDIDPQELAQLLIQILWEDPKMTSVEQALTPTLELVSIFGPKVVDEHVSESVREFIQTAIDKTQSYGQIWRSFENVVLKNDRTVQDFLMAIPTPNQDRSAMSEFFVVNPVILHFCEQFLQEIHDLADSTPTSSKDEL